MHVYSEGSPSEGLSPGEMCSEDCSQNVRSDKQQHQYKCFFNTGMLCLFWIIHGLMLKKKRGRTIWGYRHISVLLESAVNDLPNTICSHNSFLSPPALTPPFLSQRSGFGWVWLFVKRELESNEEKALLSQTAGPSNPLLSQPLRRKLMHVYSGWTQYDWLLAGEVYSTPNSDSVTKILQQHWIISFLKMFICCSLIHKENTKAVHNNFT